MRMERGAAAARIGAVAVVAVVGLGACGGGGSIAKQDGGGSVRVMADAADATLAATSARFESTAGSDGDQKSSASMTSTGVMDFRTGNSESTMDLGIGAKAMHAQVRVVDGTRYTRFPEGLTGSDPDPELAGHWVKVPDLIGPGATSPALAALAGGVGGGDFDPKGVLEALRDVGDISEVGTETVRGAETTRYHVALDVQKLIDQLPVGARASARENHVGSDASFSADVWIGEDGLVRRIALSPGTGKEGRIVLTTEFYDYGTEVNVEAPPPDEILDFSDLGRSLAALDPQ